jgi:hypothetical protein
MSVKNWGGDVCTEIGGETEGSRLFGRTGCRWDDSIALNLKKWDETST